MTSLQLTEPWILLCTIFVITSAVLSNGLQIPRSLAPAVPWWQNTQKTSIPVQAQQILKPITEISCISSDPNIYKIIEETRDRCKGTDYIVTFYQQKDKRYTKLGSFTIDKYLFHNVLMKYSNWILAGDNIDGKGDRKAIDHVTNRNNNKKGINKVFTPIASQFRTQGVDTKLPRLDRQTGDWYKVNEPQVTKYTCDSTNKILAEPNIYCELSNDDDTKTVFKEDNSHRYMDPSYNSKLKSYEVFLPKDDGQQLPSEMINVNDDNVVENDNSLVCDEASINKIESFPALVRNLDENTIEVNQIEDIMENIKNDKTDVGDLKTEVIDLLLNNNTSEFYLEPNKHIDYDVAKETENIESNLINTCSTGDTAEYEKDVDSYFQDMEHSVIDTNIYDTTYDIYNNLVYNDELYQHDFLPRSDNDNNFITDSHFNIVCLSDITSNMDNTEDDNFNLPNPLKTSISPSDSTYNKPSIEVDYDKIEYNEVLSTAAKYTEHTIPLLPLKSDALLNVEPSQAPPNSQKLVLPVSQISQSMAEPVSQISLSMAEPGLVKSTPNLSLSIKPIIPIIYSSPLTLPGVTAQPLYLEPSKSTPLTSSLSLPIGDTYSCQTATTSPVTVNYPSSLPLGNLQLPIGNSKYDLTSLNNNINLNNYHIATSEIPPPTPTTPCNIALSTFINPNIDTDNPPLPLLSGSLQLQALDTAEYNYSPQASIISKLNIGKQDVPIKMTEFKSLPLSASYIQDTSQLPVANLLSETNMSRKSIPAYVVSAIASPTFPQISKISNLPVQASQALLTPEISLTNILSPTSKQIVSSPKVSIKPSSHLSSLLPTNSYQPDPLSSSDSPCQMKTSSASIVSPTKVYTLLKSPYAEFTSAINILDSSSSFTSPLDKKGISESLSNTHSANIVEISQLLPLMSEVPSTAASIPLSAAITPVSSSTDSKLISTHNPLHSVSSQYLPISGMYSPTVAYTSSTDNTITRSTSIISPQLSKEILQPILQLSTPIFETLSFPYSQTLSYNNLTKMKPLSNILSISPYTYNPLQWNNIPQKVLTNPNKVLQYKSVPGSVLPLSVVQSEKPLPSPHQNTPTSPIVNIGEVGVPYYSSELPLLSQDLQSRSLLQVLDKPKLSENLISPMVIIPETTTVLLKPKSDWPANIISNAYPKLHPSRNIMPSLYSDFQPEAKLNLLSLPIPACSIAKPMKYIGLLHDTSCSHNISPTLFSPTKTIPKIPNLQYPCWISSNSTKVTPQVKPFGPIPFIPNSLKLLSPSDPVQYIDENVSKLYSQLQPPESLLSPALYLPSPLLTQQSTPQELTSTPLTLLPSTNELLASSTTMTPSSSYISPSVSLSSVNTQPIKSVQMPLISQNSIVLEKEVPMLNNKITQTISASFISPLKNSVIFQPSPLISTQSKPKIPSITQTCQWSILPNKSEFASDITSDIPLNSKLSLNNVLSPMSQPNLQGSLSPHYDVVYSNIPTVDASISPSVTSKVTSMLASQSQLSINKLPYHTYLSNQNGNVQTSLATISPSFNPINTPINLTGQNLVSSIPTQTFVSSKQVPSFIPTSSTLISIDTLQPAVSIPDTEYISTMPNNLMHTQINLSPISPLSIQPPITPCSSATTDSNILPFTPTSLQYNSTPSLSTVSPVRPMLSAQTGPLSLTSLPLSLVPPVFSSLDNSSPTPIPSIPLRNLFQTASLKLPQSIPCRYLSNNNPQYISPILLSADTYLSPQTTPIRHTDASTSQYTQPISTPLLSISTSSQTKYNDLALSSYPLQTAQFFLPSTVSSLFSKPCSLYSSKPTLKLQPNTFLHQNPLLPVMSSQHLLPHSSVIPWSETSLLHLWPLRPKAKIKTLHSTPTSDFISPTASVDSLSFTDLTESASSQQSDTPYSTTSMSVKPIVSPLQTPEVNEILWTPPTSSIKSFLGSGKHDTSKYTSKPFVSPLQQLETSKISLIPLMSTLKDMKSQKALPYSPTPIISRLQPSEISKVTVLPLNSPINTLLTALPYSSTPIISPLQPPEISKAMVLPQSSPINPLLTALPYSPTPIISPLQPSEISKTIVLPPSSPINPLLTALPYSSTPIISPLQPPEISKTMVLPQSSPINPLLTALPYSPTPIISPLQPSEISKTMVSPPSLPINPLLTALPYSPTPIISPLQPSEISKTIVLPPSSPINPLLTALPYSSTPIISPLQPSEISKVTVLPPSSPINTLLTALPYSSTPIISPLQPSEISKVTVLPPSSPINTLLTALPYSSTPIISPLQPSEISKVTVLPPSSPINPLLTALPYSSTPIISPLQPPEISKVIVLPPSLPINPLLTALPYSPTPIISPLQPSEISKTMVLPQSSPINPLLTALPYSPTPIISPLQPSEISKTMVLPPSLPINPLLTALPYSPTPIISPLQPSEISKTIVLPPSSPINPLLTALPYSSTPIISPLQPSEISKVTVLPPSSPINTLLTALPYSPTPIISPLQPSEISKNMVLPPSSPKNPLLTALPYSSTPIISPLQPSEISKTMVLPPSLPINPLLTALPYSPTPIISPLQPPEISKTMVLPQSSPINPLLTALPYSSTPIISPLQPSEISKVTVLPPSSPINTLLTALPYSPTPIISPLQPPEISKTMVLPQSSPINPLLTALPYSPTPIISPLQPSEISKTMVLPPSSPINTLLTALPYSPTPIISPLQPPEISKSMVLPQSLPINPLLTALPYSPTPIISPLQASEISKTMVLPQSSPINPLLTALPYSSTPIISPLQPSEISKVTVLPPSSPINTLLTALPYSPTPIISPLQPPEISKTMVLPQSSPINPLLTALPYSSTPIISPLQPSEISKVTVLPPSSPINTLLTTLPYTPTPIISPLQPPEINKVTVLPQSSPINPLLTALPYSPTPIISPLQPSEISKTMVLPQSSPINSLLTALPYSSTPIISPLQPSEISKVTVLPPSSPINTLLTALPYSSTPIISPLQPSEISEATVVPPSSTINTLLTSGSQSTAEVSPPPIVSPLQPPETNQNRITPLDSELQSSLLLTSPSVLENANIPLSSYTPNYIQHLSLPITKPSLQFPPNKQNATPSKLTKYSETYKIPSLISAMPCKHIGTISTANIQLPVYDTQYTEPKSYQSTKTTTTYQSSSSSSYLYNNPIFSTPMPSTIYTDTQSQFFKPFTSLYQSPISLVSTQMPSPQLSSFSNYITYPYLSETSSFEDASQSSLAPNSNIPAKTINYVPATSAASKLTDKQAISTQTAHYTPYSTSYSNLHPSSLNYIKPSPRITPEVISTISLSSSVIPTESSSLTYTPQTRNDVVNHQPISSSTIPNLPIIPINGEHSTLVKAAPFELVNTPMRYFTPLKTSVISENITPEYTPLSHNKYKPYQSPLWTSIYSNLPSDLVKRQSKPFSTSENPTLSDTVLSSSSFNQYITAVSSPSLNTGNVFSPLLIPLQNRNYSNEMSPLLPVTTTPLSKLSNLLSSPTLFNPINAQSPVLSAINGHVTEASPTLTSQTTYRTQKPPQFTTFTSNVKSRAPLNYVESLASPMHYTTASSSKTYSTSAQYITPLYTYISPKELHTLAALASTEINTSPNPFKYLSSVESPITSTLPIAPTDVTSSAFTSFYTPNLHKFSPAPTEPYSPFSSYKYFNIPQNMSKPLPSYSESWTTLPSSTYTTLSDKLLPASPSTDIKPIYITGNILPIKLISPEFTTHYSSNIYENLPTYSSLLGSKLSPITSPLQYPSLIIPNLPLPNVKLINRNRHSTLSAFDPSIFNYHLQEASTETVQLNPYSILHTSLNQSQLQPILTPLQSSQNIPLSLYPSQSSVLYSNLPPIRPCSIPITPSVVKTDNSNISLMTAIPSYTPLISSTSITRKPLYSSQYPACTTTTHYFSSEATPLSSQLASTESKPLMTITSSSYTPMLAKSYPSTSNLVLSSQEIPIASQAITTKFTDTQPTLSKSMPSVSTEHTSLPTFHPIQITSSSPISYTEYTSLTAISPNILPTSSPIIVNPSITYVNKTNYVPTVPKTIQPLLKPLISHLNTITPTIPSSLLNPLNYNQVPSSRLKSQNILNIGKVYQTTGVSTTPNTYYEYLKPCRHFNLSIPVPISNKFTDVTMPISDITTASRIPELSSPISQYLPDSNLKTDLYNYITNDKDLTSKLYNNKDLSIPLGNFIITKKNCNNHTTESINSLIGLKVWPSNIKLVEARLELKCIDVPSTNFEPIVNNISTYDLKEMENIVANYIRDKYGDVIVVNEKYSLNNEYEVIRNNNINVNNKYNLLWPVNTCSI